MRKSTKGALAASAAALLLLGGLGTHATWSGGSTIQGGESINTGGLSLDPSCPTSWVYGVVNRVTNVVENTKVVSVPDLDSLLLIPGDILEKTCTFTVHVQGTHLVDANLTITQPTVKDKDGNVLGSLATAVSFKDADGNSLGTTTKVADGDVITADLSVQLPATIDGLTGQNLKGTLNDVTVQISQPPA